MNWEFFTTLISLLIALSSTICSIRALRKSEKHQKEMQIQAKKQATIDAFYKIQKDVLDHLVSVEPDNANIIVNNIEDEGCEEAYGSYRAFLAKLEHFSVGVIEGVYDFEIVDKLAGVHLLYVKKTVQDIIDEENSSFSKPIYYENFRKLADKLRKRHSDIDVDNLIKKHSEIDDECSEYIMV